VPRTSGEIARFVGGTCAGDLGAHVRRIARLEEAGDGDLAFVHDARYLEAARASTASCLIVTESLVDRLGPMRVPVIAVPSAEAAINLILAAWRPVDDQPAPGRHPSAVIDPSAQVDPTARIGPHVVIGRDAVVGAGVVLEAGVVLKELVRIGAQCVLGAHVVACARCTARSLVARHPLGAAAPLTRGVARGLRARTATASDRAPWPRRGARGHPARAARGRDRYRAERPSGTAQ